MAGSTAPTTREILITYVHSRIGHGDDVNESTEMSAMLFQRAGFAFGGSQPQRIESIVEALDAIRDQIVDVPGGLEVPEGPDLQFEEWEDDTSILDDIFGGSVSWPKVLVLCEYFIGMISQHLWNGNIESAIQTFERLMNTVNQLPIGNDTIKTWLERTDRWNKVESLAERMMQISRQGSNTPSGGIIPPSPVATSAPAGTGTGSTSSESASMSAAAGRTIPSFGAAVPSPTRERPQPERPGGASPSGAEIGESPMEVTAAFALPPQRTHSPATATLSTSPRRQYGVQQMQRML